MFKHLVSQRILMWQVAMRLEIPNWASLGRSRYWPEDDAVSTGVL